MRCELHSLVNVPLVGIANKVVCQRDSVEQTLESGVQEAGVAKVT